MVSLMVFFHSFTAKKKLELFPSESDVPWFSRNFQKYFHIYIYGVLEEIGGFLWKEGRKVANYIRKKWGFCKKNSFFRPMLLRQETGIYENLLTWLCGAVVRGGEWGGKTFEISNRKMSVQFPHFSKSSKILLCFLDRKGSLFTANLGWGGTFIGPRDIYEEPSVLEISTWNSLRNFRKFPPGIAKQPWLGVSKNLLCLPDFINNRFYVIYPFWRKKIFLETQNK